MTDSKGEARFTDVKLSTHGKRDRARAMYSKGKAFVAAALLLARHAGHSEATEYVYLQLLCQGIEVTLKGLLLMHDYDSFAPRLKRPLHHDLMMIAEKATEAFGLRDLREPLRSELKQLNELYPQHLLRYGTLYDLLVAPSSIPRQRIVRRLGAVIRLAERELRRA